MRSTKRVIVVAAALFCVATLAFAQKGPGGQAHHAEGVHHGGNYNMATEVTLAGTVEAVRHMPAPANGPGGLHLMLRSESGVLEVDLGPATFVSAKGMEFVIGDQVVVVGSKVTRAGQGVIIARQVTKGAMVLTLRDTTGMPLWSGRAECATATAC